MESPPAAVEKKLRALCLKYPDSSEKTAWGHPNFKVGKKTFAALEKDKGEWVIAFKAEREVQQHLIETDERFYASPYVGAQGWVSYRLLASKKALAGL